MKSIKVCKELTCKFCKTMKVFIKLMIVNYSHSFKFSKKLIVILDSYTCKFFIKLAQILMSRYVVVPSGDDSELF